MSSSASSAVRENASGVLYDLLTDAAGAGLLEKAVFSKCRDRAVVRIVLTLRLVRNNVVLQAETFRQAEVAAVSGKTKPVQAGQENLPLDSPSGQTRDRLTGLIAACDQINLITTAGSAEFRRSRNGAEILLGAAKVRAALDAAQLPGGSAPRKIDIAGHDRVKQHILTGAEPFLIRLGVSDANGRVHDKKQPKFRQINRFLELIRDTESALPATGCLHICDLCCGKSYLSFAVYHYFTAIRHREVHMVGVDMKADVMDVCNDIARDLGMTGLSFLCADISLYESDEPVDMVISLHACDTATDLVLGKAIEWKAKVVLSTPCCHHELNRTLNCPELEFIARHSLLRQKLCDAATDALRLARLEAAGYEVAALELIDPEETPKNVMLRGVRRYDPSSSRCKAAAETLKNATRLLTGLDGD